MMFIELDGKLFNVDQIAAIIPIVEEDQCYILLSGCSPIDEGILLNLSKEEVEEELSKLENGELLQIADKLQEEIDNSKARGEGEKRGEKKK